VGAGLEIPGDGERKVDVAVAGEQVEHVVEKPHARGALTGPGAFEGQLDAHLRLGRVALDARRPAHEPPFSRTRASIDSACTSNPSARAIGAPAAASFLAASPTLTSAIVRLKCRGESPEAKWAAPAVGSTWFEPAT